MKKLYSLFAALIVAVFALAQTTPTVTIELVGGKVVFTPSSEEGRYYFAINATDDYGFSEINTPTNFVDGSLGEYTESDVDYLPVGSYEACLEDYIYEGNVEITILAAEVKWDDATSSLKRVSEVSTLVETITDVPACEGGEGEATLTIEAGKYYVSTFMDETTQYLLTTTTGTVVVLPATLYADVNTPTAAHEFEFVAVEGQDACFTIQDNTNAFLAVKSVRGLGGMSTQFTLEATKPETGAVWKVTVQDALNHVTIENTDYTGDMHCMDFDGEKAYCFGTEAISTYNLPILIKVPGASTNIQEADIDRQVIKTIENGQLILHINGVRYNILGIAL